MALTSEQESYLRNSVSQSGEFGSIALQLKMKGQQLQKDVVVNDVSGNGSKVQLIQFGEQKSTVKLLNFILSEFKKEAINVKLTTDNTFDQFLNSNESNAE